MLFAVVFSVKISTMENGAFADLDTNENISEKIRNGLYKISNKRKGRSEVWHTFGEIEKEDGSVVAQVVFCRSCHGILKFNGKQTSNLNRHKCYLMKKKITPLKKMKHEENQSITALINPLHHHEIKAKIISGDYKINDKRSKSKIWNIFGFITNETGEVIVGVVACKSCLNIYKWNQKYTSNLVRHKCYSVNAGEMCGDMVPKVCISSEWKKRGVRAFTQWSLENCRPYKIAEDSGFRNVAKYFVSVGAKYGRNIDIESAFPHPTTLSRNIADLYDIIFEEVKNRIYSIKDIGFGLTSDIWTDNYLRKSYIALTMHYVEEGSLFTRLLGLQSMEGEKCTHENIKKKVRKILMTFNCDLNTKAIIVTDRGSNMVAAFRSFQHLFCVNHLINNALQKAIQEVSDLEVLCGLCSKLVKYFKKSGMNSSLQSTLESYCPTRWNTVYYLLSLIQQNWDEITQILQERSELQRISDINITQLKGIITILEPFEESLKKLEGENYPTIHLTLMHINRLMRKCSPESEDNTMEKNFKERLRINLELVVLKNLTIYHKIALFLFPPANKMIQFDEEDKRLVKHECKLMMQMYQSELPLVSQGRELMQLSSSNKDLFSDYVQSTDVINGDCAPDHELIMYEKKNVALYDDFDVLHWWNQNKGDFPLLFKVSCTILATPATSASSERIFSLARNLISEQRSHTATNTNSVNQIMFVNANIGKDDILRKVKSII